MKNQLLEDIDHSQSGVPVRPARRVQAVASPAPPSFEPPSFAPPSFAPKSAAEQPPAPPVRQRAGVWRSRTAAPSSPVRAAQAQGPLPPPRPAHARPASAPDAPPAAHAFASPAPPESGTASRPAFGSFSSPAPDWARPLPPEPAPWTERWGRKALGWTAGLGLAVALAAGVAWLVHESQVETTLAVVADHSPPPAAAPSMAAEGVSDPEALPPPPLKLLPPEPTAAAPAAPVALEPAAESVAEPMATAEGQQVTGEEAVEAPPPAVKPPARKPAAKTPAEKPATERRVAAAPVKRSPTGDRKPASKPASKPVPKPVQKAATRPAREQVLARAPTTAPARSVPALEPDPQSPLAETLRLCRAAGYHATACLKRGCEATRYGLVCRG